MGYMRDVNGVRLDGRTVASPLIVNPAGLRRFRARMGSALLSRVDVCVVGNSIVAGVGSSDQVGTIKLANGSTVPYSASDNYRGWVGQLRRLLNAPLGIDPGEGFIFPNPAVEPRLTGTGSSYAYSGPMGNGYFLASGQTLTLPVPSSPVTAYVGVIWYDDSTALPTVTVNGAAATLFTTPGGSTAATATNSGQYVVGYVATPTAGQNLVVTGSTNGTHLCGLDLVNNPNGFHVHRMGISGAVSSDMIGGANNGVLAGSTGAFGQQDRCTRAAYQWCAKPGLLIIGHMDVNDHIKQHGTRTVTLTTASGSPTCTVTAGPVDVLDLTQPISGTGIPGGATVSALASDGSTLTLSANATASGSITATITGNTSQFAGQTPTSHAANVTQMLNDANGRVTTGALRLGWAGLILAGPRDASDYPNTPAPPYQQRQYISAAAGIPNTADSDFQHVAFVDWTKLWGSTADGRTFDMPLQISGSVHPTSMGHGDMAYTLNGLLSNLGHFGARDPIMPPL